MAEEFYDALPDQAKFPDMTALWHEQQKSIQSGERDTESFVRELLNYIVNEVCSVKENDLDLKIDFTPCPLCKRPLRRLKKKEKTSFFWGCLPCKFVCEDKAGKPVLKEPPQVSDLYKCMSCGNGLSRRIGKKKGTF